MVVKKFSLTRSNPSIYLYFSNTFETLRYEGTIYYTIFLPFNIFHFYTFFIPHQILIEMKIILKNNIFHIRFPFSRKLNLKIH